MGDNSIATQGKDIVIIGGGIIGVSVAYYLSYCHSFDPKTHRITVLEATKLAGGSSGRAGGLLAAWATPSCLAPLTFKLHDELGQKYDGQKNWGYRRVHCADMTFQSSEQAESQGISIPDSLDWIHKSDIKSYTEIGNPENSAQVHPYYLTITLADLARAKGVDFITGSAGSINYSSGGDSVNSATYDQEGEVKEVKATDVVIAAGPWSPRLFPRIPMYGVRSHSIVVEPSRSLSSYILFPVFDPPISAQRQKIQKEESPSSNIDKPVIDSVEIYPRPDNTVYICGPNDYPNLPESTAKVEVDQAMISGIKNASSIISSSIKEAKFLKAQACFRPQIRKHEDGEAVGPIVGGVKDVKGLWIATGHDEWGVQNSQGTGMILAGMIMGEEVPDIDIKDLDPSNFLTN